MTKLTYTWTDGFTFRNFKTYPEAITYRVMHGGNFKAVYTEDKDIDYDAPNPARKSYAQRLLAY